MKGENGKTLVSVVSHSACCVGRNVAVTILGEQRADMEAMFVDVIPSIQMCRQLVQVSIGYLHTTFR